MAVNAAKATIIPPFSSLSSRVFVTYFPFLYSLSLLAISTRVWEQTELLFVYCFRWQPPWHTKVNPFDIAPPPRCEQSREDNNNGTVADELRALSPPSPLQFNERPNESVSQSVNRSIDLPTEIIIICFYVNPIRAATAGTKRDRGDIEITKKKRRRKRRRRERFIL